MTLLTNLVPPLGQFVGRDAVMEEIEAALTSGTRLVTLLGPPGMGKTRLALRYAELRGGPFLAGGGVWFCDLTEARDAAEACAIVARTVGSFRGRVPDRETMVDDLADALAGLGPVLVVLDNFEQLDEAAARAVERWSALAPDAHFVVTSRHRLGVTGEHVFDLMPLALESEAVILFEARARAAGGWDDHRASLASEVAALVRALDGIPLAIELAAARSRVLAPAELLARLEARTKGALLGGARALSSRHATLRAAIDWSWSMLSDTERSALVQCAIFAGDFSLDAAENVIDVQADVLDVVAALRDKSLLRSSSRDGETRFSLYVSIREYAADKLAGKPAAFAAALAARHRRYYLALTTPWYDAYARRGDVQSRARLASEKDNLLVVQRALAATGEERRDLALTTLHLDPTIEAELPYDELISVYSAGIEAAGEDAPLRGRLLVGRGKAYGLRGESGPCLADLELARDLGVACADPLLEAEARTMCGVRYRQLGRYEDAWNAGQEAARLLEGAGAPRPEGANFAVMGLLLCELGRAEESRVSNERALAIFEPVGDRWSQGLALSNLAQLAQAAGEHDLAARHYEDALSRFREVGDRRYEGRYCGYRGSLEHERGELASARALYETCIESLDHFRMRHQQALFQSYLGALEAQDGHLEKAERLLDTAARLLHGVVAPAYHETLAVHRAHLALARGDEAPARAALAPTPLSKCSEDIRLAQRLLSRALTQGSPRARAEVPALVVDADARGFSLGGAARVDLARRGAMRLVLLALVERHPGAVTGAELLALGWPGERVLAEAGATRVRVAVATLRRLGLASVLLTRDDGYLLDPRVPVTFNVV